MHEDNKCLMNKVETADGYTIIHYDYNKAWLKMDVVEEKYKAKYIGEFSLQLKYGGWTDQPVSIFYTEIPHPEGSNYFGMYEKGAEVYITNGLSAAEHEWVGIMNPLTKEILYSAFRHDYQLHEGLMADGGAEYTRTSEGTLVQISIVKDKLIVEEI